MGRYSFFIINFAFAWNNVYADTRHSDVLSSRNSSDSGSNSIGNSSDTSSVESSVMEPEQENHEIAEIHDEIQGPQLEETLKPFIPWYLDEVLMNGRVETRRFDENDNELPQISTRAAGDVWGSGNFARVQDTVGNPPVATRYINAAFQSWEFGGAVINQAAVNNIIARGVRNSVTATNTRIDNTIKRIEKNETWIAGHNTWAGNLSSRVDTLYSWKIGADNFFETTRGRLNTLESWKKGADTFFSNYYAWKSGADNFFETTRGRLNTLESWKKGADTFFSNYYAWKAGADKFFSSASDRLDKNEKWISDHNTWAGNLSARVDTLYSWKTGADNFFETTRGRLNTLESWKTGADTFFSNYYAWKAGADKFFSDQRTNNSAQQSEINALGTWKNVQLAWNTVQELEIGKLKGRNGQVTGDLNSQKRQGNYYASGVLNGPVSEKSWGYLVVINNFDDGNGIYQEFTPDTRPNQKYIRLYHSSFGGWSKWENMSVSKSDIEALKSKDTELSNSLNSVKSLISTESMERKNADVAINSRLLTIDQEIKTLNQKIDDFNWSDVGIIAAIIGIHDAWQSKNYSGPVLTDDGALVKLIKYQRDAIITSFSAVLHNVFGDPADGYLGLFWKHFDSQIYNLRYSIISGFEELKTANKVASDAIRDNQSSMLTHLETMNGWLKLIYEKPNTPIIQNPFDFDRLEELLKNLKMNVNIGDTVNEAGTNIWDFLKALVKELGDVLREILDFLEKLIDTLIHLVVPKNLDFATTKFDSTGDKIKLKFSFVFGWIDTFKSLFGTTKPFEDFNLNLGGMFEGNVNVPISAINKFAPLVKTIITGFILLEFLIDMYKWFHSKGEVIE